MRLGGLVFPYLKNFPQFVVIHTVKGFSIVSEAEVDIFLEFPCFFYDPMDVSNLISGSSPFLNPACISGSSVSCEVTAPFPWVLEIKMVV